MSDLLVSVALTAEVRRTVAAELRRMAASTTTEVDRASAALGAATAGLEAYTAASERVTALMLHRHLLLDRADELEGEASS